MKKKIAAIDVGTTKICTHLGPRDTAGVIRVLGLGIVPSRGVEKALITDYSRAKEAIRESVRKAEMMAGYRLDSAYIGITGRHITSTNSRGAIAISHNDMTVRADDMKRSVDQSSAIKISPEQKVLHVIPRVYRLDGLEVKNPLGMKGTELETEVNVVTAAVSPVNNLIKIVHGLRINIDDLVLEPLASAEAVLAEDEKQAGVMIADIGGGTTDLAIIKDGSILYTSVLPAAGHQITTDIVSGLGLSYELAEEMKKTYGSLLTSEKAAEMDRTIGENGHSVSFRALYEIMQARVEEILRLMLLELPAQNASGLIPAGVVLTGGCANIPGIIEVAEQIFRMPVRTGAPVSLNGISAEVLNNPAYATGVGLLLWNMNNRNLSSWFTKRTGWRGFMDQIGSIFK
jgi:cell division protein FtsA